MSARRLSLLLSLPVSLASFNLACSSEEFVTARGAALHQAEDCKDLLAQIQADAIAKVDEQIAFAKQYGSYTTRGTGNLSLGAPSSPSSEMGTNNTDAGSGVKDDSAGPTTHSETNTQVLGVDEADIVKMAGERIYLIHGDQFFMFDSWPADQTRILGQTKIEGTGYELFVEGGKATLFSTVFPTDVPDRSGKVAPAPGDVAIGCLDCYGGSPFTKVSVFDVSGNTPLLERELLIEGTYVSSRRHGDVVRTIVQGGFAVPYLFSPSIETYDSLGKPLSDNQISEQLERYRSDATRDIRASTLEDWIPRRFERKDGALSELDAGCADYFVPEPGKVANGVSQVVTFNVKKFDEPSVVSVLGGADTVYANADKMVLAQRDYSYNWGGTSTTRTALHEFGLEGAKTDYEGSGFVPGYLVNQFSIDERRGVVRVTTTEDTVTDPNTWTVQTENRVYQLKNREGVLGVTSKSPAIGKAGERIMATRFVGDRAYVVTFLQTDPLIVVNIPDEKTATVAGELFIPGFSEYMHPLDAGHLLTIGRDGTDTGASDALALQIFDVSDPTAPSLTFKEVFPASSSEAGANHKAFTFVKDHFAPGVGLLLFPRTTYDPSYESTLEVLKVDTNGGFTRLGSIDHTTLLTKGCADFFATYGYCDYGGQEMRRGVTSDDFVYAISYGGLSVYSLTDLATPLAPAIELPSPQFWDYGYAVGGGGAAVDPVPTPDTGAPMGGASSL